MPDMVYELIKWMEALAEQVFSTNTTTPGLLTSLTKAAILRIFISGWISMNFGMVGLDHLLKQTGSYNVVFGDNLLVPRVTSLTMAAILEFFIYDPIWPKIGILSLDDLPSHMGSCNVVCNANLLVHEVNLLGEWAPF